MADVDLSDDYLAIDNPISIIEVRRSLDIPSTTVENCTRRAVTIAEVADSNGAYLMNDVLVSVPRAELGGFVPLVGDIVLIGADPIGYELISFVDATMRSRYRYQLRGLTISGFYSTTVRVMVDGGQFTGEMGEPKRNLVGTGVVKNARVQPTDNVELMNHERRMMISDATIYLDTLAGSSIELTPANWLVDLTTMKEYRVIETANQEIIGAFQVVRAAQVTR